MHSQILRVMFPDGSPNGIRVIEIPNWAGKAFIVPRGSLAALGEEHDLRRPGSYFLLGEGESESRPRVYIGESENVLSRILNHQTNKDFWNIAVIFIGDDLDRAKVKYLEHKSVNLAKKINRNDIENFVHPLENRLSEFDRVATDQYFETVQFVLAFLNYTLFQEIPTKTTAKDLYYFKTVGVEARGTLLESGEFIVYKDSTARIAETPSFKKIGSKLRHELEAKGILKRQDVERFIFAADYIFQSPSAAGDTVAGRSTNGWVAWVDDVGKTLDENVRK